MGTRLSMFGSGQVNCDLWGIAAVPLGWALLHPCSCPGGVFPCGPGWPHRSLSVAAPVSPGGLGVVIYGLRGPPHAMVIHACDVCVAAEVFLHVMGKNT